MSRDALETLKKLPRHCYGVLNGESVVIERGANQAMPVATNRSYVDVMNAQSGVTQAQRMAMEAGITFGWTHEAADPDFHCQVLGQPVPQVREYVMAVPLLAICKVQSRSEEMALSFAARWLEGRDLPDFITVDGQFDIIEERDPE